MSFRTRFITGLLLGLTFSFCAGAAEAPAKPAADPARKCVMCHKKEPAKMQGVHAQALNPHDNTTVNCTNCHVPVDPQAKPHPGNRKNITMYAPLFPGLNAQPETAPAEATDSNATTEAAAPESATPSDAAPVPSMPVAVQQGQLCMNCHTPETLREAFWPHDVHAAQLSCTDCHKLHPKEDPVIGLTEAQKTTMCLDCHATVKTEVTP